MDRFFWLHAERMMVSLAAFQWRQSTYQTLFLSAPFCDVRTLHTRSRCSSSHCTGENSSYQCRVCRVLPKLVCSLLNQETGPFWKNPAYPTHPTHKSQDSGCRLQNSMSQFRVFRALGEGW